MVKALNPEDILDLPFWRHRWQVYELWTVVVALTELLKFGFTPAYSSDGKSLLEAGKASVVAIRHSPPRGYVYVQPTYINVHMFGPK